MAPPDKQTTSETGYVGAIARYAIVCVAIGAVVAGLVVAVLGGKDDDTQADLPPVRQTQLVLAAHASGCELHRSDGSEQLKPPVDGPYAAPAAPGFYEEPPPTVRLTGALRTGVIVIFYREGLDEERLEQLRSLQTVIPSGTIVAPDTSGMRYEVAVAAYRRLLGCDRFTDAAIDALRLFRGRYVGTGPDR